VSPQSNRYVIDTGQLKLMYRQMLLIRRFEERALEMRAAGTIHGVVHPYIGQEAIAVGMCFQLNKADRITSTHRGHGHCLAKGADPARMFAELLGRVDGYSQGKGGSMHIADFSCGMLGANGIVGAGLPIAAGAALASKFNGDATVAVCFFGDGALASGSFHEALNLSALWQLPVIWTCENNGWANATPTHIQLAAQRATDLADAYGIPAERVDGNDVCDVAEAAARAVGRARTGGGPTLIEGVTFRMERHAVQAGTPADPRPKALLESWRQRDPLIRLRERLTREHQAREADFAEISADIECQLDKAIEFAASSPLPGQETALDGVFSPEGIV
jgi:acetoin:2,6-dichlorophenolindophenol oxidoreductase subunit alpha